jgi:hypothetical protein
MSDYLTDLNEHYKKVRARLGAPPAVQPVVVPVAAVALEPPKPVVVVPPPPPKEYPMKGVFLPPEIKEKVVAALRECDMQWVDAISQRKTNQHLIVRAKIYVVLRRHGWSLKRIGRFCGGRDHSTIYNTLNNLEHWGVEP